jgi:hypothetical protein
MHRIRISLPYFEQYGWQSEIVTVDESYSEMVKDPLLLKSLPNDVIIHRVKAFNKKWTSKVGLGSLALRSLWFYKIYVNKLLEKENFDLIYFSTTQFPVMILGAYWKKKYNIPYVIDMQDPWHTDYYKTKAKKERPKKFWFSYRLNKFLEPIALKSVDGLISVSEKYIIDLQKRYESIKAIPKKTIPFSVLEKDFEIAEELPDSAMLGNKISFLYLGVVGKIMEASLHLLFRSLKNIKDNRASLYEKITFNFIGTSYAKTGGGEETVTPIAKKNDVLEIVKEQTDRIGFYASLSLLIQADGLIIIGTDDPGYTASKLYPYILAKKPLFSILHEKSDAIKIINECNAGMTTTIQTPFEEVNKEITKYIENVIDQSYAIKTNWTKFKKYTAREMTLNQCLLFDEVIKEYLIKSRKS